MNQLETLKEHAREEAPRGSIEGQETGEAVERRGSRQLPEASTSSPQCIRVCVYFSLFSVRTLNYPH